MDGHLENQAIPADEAPNATAVRAARRQTRRRVRLAGAAGLSLVAHLSLVALLVLVRLGTPPAPDAAPISVSLVRWRPPAPPAPAPTPQKTAAAKPPPPRHTDRPIPPPPDIKPLVASRSKSVESGPGVSDAALAGAAIAGSGGGASCDMAQRVQDALRKDPLVRAAASTISGKAVMVWNGDWVRSNSEDGKGLAAVREAILWEVAFAPAVCRAQPVRGLVMFSLGGPPASTRLVVGQGEWRWSDLLTPRRYTGEG